MTLLSFVSSYSPASSSRLSHSPANPHISVSPAISVSTGKSFDRCLTFSSPTTVDTVFLTCVHDLSEKITMVAINGGGSGAPALAPLSPEVQAVFRESIGLVLSRWSALRMAVENEWGGRNSHLIPDQLASDIFFWYTLSKELSLYDCPKLRYLPKEWLSPTLERLEIWKCPIVAKKCLEGKGIYWPLISLIPKLIFGNSCD